MLSLKVLVPFSHLQQLARPSRRPFAAAFREGRRFRRESATWSLDRRREWMLQRLRKLVRRAYHETVYYRELFDRIGFDPHASFSFEDYARLPVLEREDVQRAGASLVSRAIPADQLRKDATGGSTGVPTEIWLGPEERGWRESGGEYFMERFGVPSGSRTGSLWGHHLDPMASDSLRDRYRDFVANARWFDCLRLSPAVLERYHQEFSRFRPASIVAYASALAHLAEYLLEQGLKPNYPTRCMVTGAEKLLPYHRAAIEMVFSKPVHERYGSRDAGYIAFQMAPWQSLDYEVDWANILVEPESDEPDSAILVTKLHSDGMPMLRYRVGDLGRFPEGSEPGKPVFVLHEVLGRETDRIWLPDGRWITGLQIPHLIKDFPVYEYMCQQRADYGVELKIVPKNGFGEDSRQQILALLEPNLPGLSVSITLTDQIPRTRANKWRPVVSEVKSGESSR